MQAANLQSIFTEIEREVFSLYIIDNYSHFYEVGKTDFTDEELSNFILISKFLILI